MASVKKKPDDVSPSQSPTDNAAAAVDFLQQTLDTFIKNNSPVATLPNPADIKPTGNAGPPTPVNAPPTNPQPTPAPVSQQPQAQQQTVGDIIDSIMNKKQILTGPAGDGSTSKKSGGLTDITKKFGSGGSSGSGGLGQISDAISGISKIAGLFGL